uniref:Uncharacterized protein n=1 Tax=Arundo donax TaxID=35708 RepID=A0A0A9H944_ARUDO
MGRSSSSPIRYFHRPIPNFSENSSLFCSSNLFLQALNVGGQLFPAFLEEEVAIHEPARVAEPNELQDLGKQRHGVDGADDHGRQPEGDDGAAAVQEHGGLVLNGVPLCFEVLDELVAGGRGVLGGGLRAEQREPRRILEAKRADAAAPGEKGGARSGGEACAAEERHGVRRGGHVSG